MKKSGKQSESKTTDPTVAPPAELDSKTHTLHFAAAMKLFTSGDYRQALEMFERISNGPLLPVNESAQMYARMCGQRISREEPGLTSPEDHYNFAVGLINTRRFEDARRHLEIAVNGSTQPDYLYALAIAEGSLGAFAQAAEHLRLAIHTDPSLRGHARHDSDFLPLLQNAQIREILAGEPAPAA